jgi:hypothetical protein
MTVDRYVGSPSVVGFCLPKQRHAQISHQECVDEGGEVVGDIGDGSSFSSPII